MKVCFYLPEAHLPSAEDQAAWRDGGKVSLQQTGKSAAVHAWIFRTWAALDRIGCNADLVHRLPEQGAVIALSGTLPRPMRLPRDLFLVDIVADGLPHEAACLHVVQNAAHAAILPWSEFMPHWPQPGLVPRDSRRGGKFERVAFFGDAANLATELRSAQWQDELKQRTGLAFEIRGADRWHDYSDVDAVVAVRDFSTKRQLHKPATKLYNAWLAGVPFIGGTDSAYAADGEAGRDYLVARTSGEVMAHLAELSQSDRLRDTLVARGREKVRKFNEESTLHRWRKLVEETIPEKARKRKAACVWSKVYKDLARKGVCAVDRILRS